ncbi:platelet glycoprotein V isoform X1 [Cricetulus griseus]|uniref:platelet glycoprotein V isoform X1 n=1 Tax=Cricetulus griseus TaxID=10029 RepID=UPI00022F663E|nr:platelet glycoprotein V isoform X1 [Cricetulus griseus]
MLRSALLCAVLALVHVQPIPCPKTCRCVFRDAAQCSGGSVARIASLGLPKNLTHILLFRMEQGVLGNLSFSGMTVLQRLMLSDSHISAIEPGTFNDLIKLKTLRLTRTRISHLPSALLDKMVLLEQLFLDHNALRDLDQNLFQKLLNLQELCLNQNQLSFLPANLFTSLGELKALDLSGNNLTHLPQGLLGAQVKLETLLLYSNQLMSVDSGLLGNLRSLIELRLDRNRLRPAAAGAFDSLGNLSSLTLSRNRLESLPPELFLRASSVTRLTLFENPLEELPEVLFGEMAGLRELWLNDTQLHNRLRALPRALFLNLSSLETVQLEHNQLETLPGDVFAALPQLTRVLLAHNPWLCDCGLWPFLEWQGQHQDLLGREEPPQCHGPELRAGLSFWDLLQGDPWCPHPRGLPLNPPTENTLEAPVPSQLPNSSQSRAWVQLVARDEGPDHRFYWGLYILLLLAQAVVAGIIVFAMIKIGQLFRSLIRERLLLKAMEKSCN